MLAIRSEAEGGSVHLIDREGIFNLITGHRLRAAHEHRPRQHRDGAAGKLLIVAHIEAHLDNHRVAARLFGQQRRLNAAHFNNLRALVDVVLRRIKRFNLSTRFLKGKA